MKSNTKILIAIVILLIAALNIVKSSKRFMKNIRTKENAKDGNLWKYINIKNKQKLNKK